MQLWTTLLLLKRTTHNQNLTFYTLNNDGSDLINVARIMTNLI